MRSDISTIGQRKHWYPTAVAASKALRAKLRRKGLTPSGGCWEDSETMTVFSAETYGRETYGASRECYVARLDSSVGMWYAYH